MTAAILCIGTELTRGEINNTNATWLARQLTELGLEVTGIEVVDDEPERIQQALARLGSSHACVVTTGGLGPTTDDLTTASVAGLLGVPLVRDAASLDAIETRMRRVGRPMAASNAKQADFPEGATILPNSLGTAPGFRARIGEADAFFLPGVPREMFEMFAMGVAPALAGASSARRIQIRLRTFGMAESAVNDALAGVEERHRVTLAYRAHFPEIEVKVRPRTPSAEDDDARTRAAANEICARLGQDVVYGEGDAGLPEVVGQMLTERGLRLGVAESCTGGLVGALLTDVAGSSGYFVGGVIAYSNQVKEEQLGVPGELLARHGAVSPEVARAMAQGARTRFGLDLALALTGVAGPDGGTPDKPVGTVHYAVAHAGGCTDERLLFPASRDLVRKRAAYAALSLVRRILLQEGSR